MTVLGAGRSVIETVREENVPFMAAAIAYYAVASFVPLLLLALALLSAFGATETLLEALRSVLPESGSEALNRVWSDVSGHGVAGGVGLVLALWSGSKIFRALAVAFDEIYRHEADLSLVGQLKKSVLTLGALFLGFVSLSALSVALTVVDVPLSYPALVGNVVAVVVLSLAFLPVFYIMPPLEVTVRHALPGAVATAVGWVLLQVGFYYYAGAAGRYAAYGFLGAVLLFVTFLYLGAIVLLVGAAVNVALDRHATVRFARSTTDA